MGTPDHAGGGAAVGGGRRRRLPDRPGRRHRVFNPGAEPARVLLVSTQVVPEIVVYPDTGGTLAMTGPAEGLAFPAGTDVPYRGEAARAFTAAVERDGG